MSEPGEINIIGHGCLPADFVSWYNDCEMMGDLTNAAGWLAALGGGLALIPEPATTVIGGMMVAAFLPLGLFGFGYQVFNDC